MADTTEPAGEHVEARGLSALVSQLRSYVSKALRFWEPCRLIYNGVLSLVVALHLIVGFPATWAAITGNMLLGFFFLAVLANVCYCAVYPVDLFVRFSGLDGPWRTARWVVLAIGCSFGATITHFFCIGLFENAR